ncbi:hypothetical protein RIF29_12669 [Crotalaria pallida]|uniref:Uncharacterized protein n=1 Tax=Crotalaria pallida TaxID=3830 RepID=A0AAN9P169_CROPI
MVPNTRSFSSDMRRSFPSLKLKSQVLRSSSFGSEFRGKKIVFRVNRAIPNRVNSHFQTSTVSQGQECGKLQWCDDNKIK